MLYDIVPETLVSVCGGKQMRRSDVLAPHFWRYRRNYGFSTSPPFLAWLFFSQGCGIAASDLGWCSRFLQDSRAFISPKWKLSHSQYLDLDPTSKLMLWAGLWGELESQAPATVCGVFQRNGQRSGKLICQWGKFCTQNQFGQSSSHLILISFLVLACKFFR